jgi:hypothetical protein
MTAPMWHLAITDVGQLADGHIGDYPTATETARTVVEVLDRVAGLLLDWSTAADPEDPLTGHAVEIADRLGSEAAELRAPRTEDGYAEILDDPNVAAIPLNTLALHEDARSGREPYTDTPVPFSGRWSDRALWLQTWTTSTGPEPGTPRPVMRAAPAVRGIHPLTRLRKAQP